MTPIEKVLAEVLSLRKNYATEVNADGTAIAVIDDIIALLEKELA